MMRKKKHQLTTQNLHLQYGHPALIRNAQDPQAQKEKTVADLTAPPPTMTSAPPP